MIQIRTFRDVGEDLSDIDHLVTWQNTSGSMQYVNCSLHGVNQALRHRANFMDERAARSHICVYITSDNKAISAFIKSRILSVMPTVAIVTDGELLTLNRTEWQSSGMMSANQRTAAINLNERSDLQDWMVLSNALSAVYFDGSTFADTARLRAGYFAMRNDYVVTTDSDNPQCRLRLNRTVLCDHCRSLGSLCPTGARVDSDTSSATRFS